jgi:hypothetical protein
MVQCELNLLAGTRGGWRPGAGRKRDPRRHDPMHCARGHHKARLPLHVTMRCLADVPRLRSAAISQAIRGAMVRVRGFEGFRVIQMSIQATHLHLIVEADRAAARSLGMASFTIAVAKAIDCACGRRGAVFAHRYHAVVLGTPKQVRYAIAYVLGNWRHHHEDQRSPASRRATFDPYSTAYGFDGWECAFDGTDHLGLPIDTPTVWLLTIGWRLHGAIDPSATPGPATGRAGDVTVRGGDHGAGAAAARERQDAGPRAGRSN